MKIKCISLGETNVNSGCNLNELNECSLVGGSRKQEK